MVLRRLLVMATAAFVAVSCTSSTTTATPTPPPSELSGTIRSLGIDRSRASVTTLDLASGAAENAGSSIPVEVVNRGEVVAAATPSGEWIVGAELHAVQVYRVIGSQAPKAVGPDLSFRGSSSPQVVIGTHGAAVATCHGVYELSFSSADRWSRVGSGCWAAVSDDGRSLAYAPDGRHLLIRSLVDHEGPPVSIDLEAALAPMLGMNDPKPRLVGRPAWGSAGLAFVVRAGDQIAVFVRDPSGRISEVLQERDANPYREPLLAWQPNGTVLAISDDVGPAGPILRLFDTADGSIRAVGSDVIGFAGLVWSPRGDALAILTSASALIVMTLDGTWLLRRETDWRRLLSWTGTA